MTLEEAKAEISDVIDHAAEGGFYPEERHRIDAALAALDCHIGIPSKVTKIQRRLQPSACLDSSMPRQGRMAWLTRERRFPTLQHNDESFLHQ
jgi:hypothetical protein